MERKQININFRGNGACPLCIKNKKDRCPIHSLIEKSLNVFKDEFEIVIYKCPMFVENGK
jgi:hypothetical protein